MFIFSLWTTNANLDIVPVWNLDNYAQFFNSSAYVRTLGKTVLMGAAVTAICLVIAVRGRVLPGPLHLTPLGAPRPPRHHRPVLVELPAAGLLVAGDPR